MDLITTKYARFVILLIAKLVETRNLHLIDKTLPGFTKLLLYLCVTWDVACSEPKSRI